MTKGFGTPSPSLNEKRCPRPTAVTDTLVIESSFLRYFQDFDDPRVERTRRHELLNIIVIAILAVIAGARGWEDIENYGQSKRSWLEQFLELPNGIPSADTIRRIFERLDPAAFEQCFRQWVGSLVKHLDARVLSLDGKCLKGSYDRGFGQTALQMVSAWAGEHRLVLGQVKVEDKSNEITAIPALLDLLNIAGSIVTIDAMGTQTAIAAEIKAKQADYVLTLKANHPTLYKQVKNRFEQALNEDFAGLAVSRDTKVEGGHHRRERRQVYCVPVEDLGPLHGEQQWSGLQTVVMVVRIRHLWNQTTREVQFYLSSLEADAVKIGRAVRQHWGIENGLHWCLDVTFAEDDSRIRRGFGSHNFALLRRLALNALNRERSCKRSTVQKSKRAAMNNSYLLQVLAACLPEESDSGTVSQ